MAAASEGEGGVIWEGIDIVLRRLVAALEFGGLVGLLSWVLYLISCKVRSCLNALKRSPLPSSTDDPS